MHTLDCTDIKALLSPYLDGEMDADMRHLAERHLSECATCRALVDETERLDGLLVELARSDAGGALSPDFIGGVMSRTVYAEPARRSWSRAWITWTGWSAAAASLVLAAVLWINDRREGMLATGPLSASHQDVTPPTGAVADDYPRPVIRTTAYETGAGLRSQTFDGSLPVQAFRTVWAEPLEPHEPYEPTLRSVMREREELGFGFDEIDRAIVHGDELDVEAAGPASHRAAADVSDQAGAPALPAARPAIARDDAETFYATSLVLEALADAELHSFADVERVRRITEFDELLPRLRRARERVDAQDRTAVLAAESLLTRVMHGPLNREDVQVLRDTVAQLDLSREMGEMSLRENSSS